MLQVTDERGIILPIADGFVLCPRCLASGRRRKIQHLRPDTVVSNLALYCRYCKAEYVVDIRDSQSLQGQS